MDPVQVAATSAEGLYGAYATRGLRLSKAMSVRGITKISVLAKQLNVSESAVSRWRNEGPMTLQNVVALCVELSMSADWLLFGIGDMELNTACAITTFTSVSKHLRALPSPVRESLLTFLETLVKTH
ncbi:helix-turn-helix domain-containing protein [Dyella psychrodurans]